MRKMLNVIANVVVVAVVALVIQGHAFAQWQVSPSSLTCFLKPFGEAPIQITADSSTQTCGISRWGYTFYYTFYAGIGCLNCQTYAAAYPTAYTTASAGQGAVCNTPVYVSFTAGVSGASVYVQQVGRSGTNPWSAPCGQQVDCNLSSTSIGVCSVVYDC